jgi:hypothetical protein
LYSARQRVAIDVAQHRLISSGSGDLRDSVAHSAGANDADCLNCLRSDARFQSFVPGGVFAKPRRLAFDYSSTASYTIRLTEKAILSGI